MMERIRRIKMYAERANREARMINPDWLISEMKLLMQEYEDHFQREK